MIRASISTSSKILALKRSRPNCTSADVISLVVLPPIAEESYVFSRPPYSSLEKKPCGSCRPCSLTSAFLRPRTYRKAAMAARFILAALIPCRTQLVLIYLREKPAQLVGQHHIARFKNGVAFLALFHIHI